MPATLVTIRRLREAEGLTALRNASRHYLGPKHLRHHSEFILTAVWHMTITVFVAGTAGLEYAASKDMGVIVMEPP